jgi:hypothetical protein
MSTLFYNYYEVYLLSINYKGGFGLKRKLLLTPGAVPTIFETPTASTGQHRVKYSIRECSVIREQLRVHLHN